MAVRLIHGDCRDVLKTLESESFDMILSSPPYWGLRDYGTATWEGGDPACAHSVGGQVQDSKAPGAITTGVRPGVDASRCRKCGARRIDAQIGLEPTLEAYIETIAVVAGEVWRVLKPEGTFWLNLGDCYNAGRNGGHPGGKAQWKPEEGKYQGRSGANVASLKPKDLCMIPARVALRLQADGWWVRCEIIWSKPNPMPESVEDRPTSAHEKVFLLSKSESYFYDADAIAEDAVSTTKSGNGYARSEMLSRGGRGQAQAWDDVGGKRNRRNVWTIATQPYPDAHFATMAPDLAELCIKAGSSERGSCRDCGKPWERIVQKTLVPGPKAAKTFIVDARDLAADKNDQGSNRQKDGHKPGWRNEVVTVGWKPTCACPAREIVPAKVLDPFGGAGTTGLVADRLGRDATLIDLNPDYRTMAADRITGDAPLFAEIQ